MDTVPGNPYAQAMERTENLDLALMGLLTRARVEGWTKGQYEDAWNALYRNAYGLTGDGPLMHLFAPEERGEPMPPLPVQ